jgi:hypothetical protein
LFSSSFLFLGFAQTHRESREIESEIGRDEGETRVGPDTSGGPVGGGSAVVDAGEAEGSNSGGLEVRNPAKFSVVLGLCFIR